MQVFAQLSLGGVARPRPRETRACHRLVLHAEESIVGAGNALVALREAGCRRQVELRADGSREVHAYVLFLKRLGTHPLVAHANTERVETSDREARHLVGANLVLYVAAHE